MSYSSSSLPQINRGQRSSSQVISPHKKVMQSSLSRVKFKQLKMDSTSTVFKSYQSTQSPQKNAPILLENGREISLTFQSRVPPMLSPDPRRKIKIKKPQPESESSRQLTFMSKQQEQYERPAHSKLVDQNAQAQFYDYYRNMEQIRQKQKENEVGESPFHTILRYITLFNLPPKTYQFIKQKGDQKCIRLERMGLGRNPALLMIASVIESLERFSFLNLSQNDIGPDIAHQIIKKIKSIKDVDLSFNSIGAVGIMQFVKTLRNPQCKIRSINLQKNGLGDKSVKMFIDAVRNNKTIKKINLSQNMIALPSCLSIKSLLLQTQQLEQLYLHWCDLDKLCGQAIYQGLTANKTLKIMDLSWNKIGDHPPSLTLLTTIIEGNTNLIHVDLCFCEYTFEQSKCISDSLQENNNMTGFHFQGNYGFTNHKGFLIIKQKKKKKYQQFPAPIKYKTSIRRIHAVDWVEWTQDPKQQLVPGTDICWICMGWQQLYFRIDKRGEDEQHFIHLSTEQFSGVKMAQREDWVELSRVVPIGKLEFFFSTGKQIDTKFTIEAYATQSTDFKLSQLRKGELTFADVQIKEVNTIEVQKKCEIYNQYYEYLFKTPIRSKDLKVIGKKGLIFGTSYFKNWKFESKKMIQQCWKYDLQNSKIQRLLKKQSDLLEIQKVVKDNYQVIRNVYTLLASKEITHENTYGISSFSALGFGKDFGIISKKFTQALYAIKFVASSTKEGDKSKDPNRLMTRSSFIEFLIRLAEQKYLRGKFVDKDGNPVKYSYAEGLKKIIEKLIAYDSVYNFTNWRSNRYWNQDNDKILKIFRGFLEKLFQKYAGTSIKIKRKVQKQPLGLSEFKQIFTDCKLNTNNETDTDLNICFDLSRMLTFEEADFIRRINILQFTEAITRFADKRQFFPIGYTVDTFSDYQIKVMPLSMKLEGLLFKLLEANRDLSNPRIEKYTRRSLFTEQVIEFQFVTNRLNEFNETQNEGFVSFLKQNSKVKINSLEQRKIETSEQISQLKFQLQKQDRIKRQAKRKERRLAMERKANNSLNPSALQPTS